uniref:Gustatory receptor n=1 Tax=Lutzomyia longipalpis TaxID=7200 RepID=A0A240SXV1_LUTLO
MLPKYLDFYFNFLRCFGICLETPNMTERSKFLIYFWAISLLFFIPIMGVWAILSMKISHLNETLIFVQIILVYSATFSIVLETFLAKNHQFRFWKLIEKLEYSMSETQNLIPEYRSFSCSTKRRILICFAYSVAIECFVVAMHKVYESRFDSIRWSIGWLVYYYFIAIGRMQNHNHILVIQILKMHAKFFNEDLRRTGRVLMNSTNQNVAKELNLIKFRHAYLWEAVETANKCNRWSQFFNIIQNFFLFTSAFYWAYIFVRIPNFFNVFKCIISTVPSIVDTAYLCHESQTLQEEAGKTGSILQGFLTNYTNRLHHFTKNCIVELCLQMHHEKIRIVIGGIFTLNMAFLTVFAGTIVTYLVIILQNF